MFAEVDPDGQTADALERAYAKQLNEAVTTAGIDAVVDATDLDREAVEQIDDGGRLDLQLSTAATVLALADGRDPDAIEADARDRLLLAMSSAVLDVDALKRGLDRETSAKELQAKIEGRHPMTVAEYAEIAACVAGEQ